MAVHIWGPKEGTSITVQMESRLLDKLGADFEASLLEFTNDAEFLTKVELGAEQQKRSYGNNQDQDVDILGLKRYVLVLTALS